MTTVELSPIVKTVQVGRNAADAFRLFTEEITQWWPIKQHSRAKDALGEVTVRVEMEPVVGGRLFETLNTGEQRDWGEVLAYEPGRRVLFSFQMGRPKEKSGEVEVLFEPLGDKSCRVTLTHGNWDSYGEDAEPMRRGFNNGWEAVFMEGFGKFAGTI